MSFPLMFHPNILNLLIWQSNNGAFRCHYRLPCSYQANVYWWVKYMEKCLASYVTDCTEYIATFPLLSDRYHRNTLPDSTMTSSVAQSIKKGTLISLFKTQFNLLWVSFSSEISREVWASCVRDCVCILCVWGACERVRRVTVLFLYIERTPNVKRGIATGQYFRAILKLVKWCFWSNKIEDAFLIGYWIHHNHNNVFIPLITPRGAFRI